MGKAGFGPPFLLAATLPQRGRALMDSGLRRNDAGVGHRRTKFHRVIPAKAGIHDAHRRPNGAYRPSPLPRPDA